MRLIGKQSATNMIRNQNLNRLEEIGQKTQRFGAAKTNKKIQMV